MEILLLLIAAIGGYFLGSISMAVILTKIRYSGDVRQEGSGNAGATNVARVFGMRAGLFTLVGDMIKTFAAAGFGYLLAGTNGMVAGLFGAVIGHCFPVYFGFKGGKGISVSLAIALCLDWQMTIISLSLFIIIVLITRYVSLGSLIAVASVPIVYFCFNGFKMPQALLVILVPILVWYMHRGNIKKLISGTESKFVPKKK